MKRHKIFDVSSLYFKRFFKDNRLRLTKRAPDAGDSAAISSSFLRLNLFPVGRLRRPRPSAGIPYGDDGANR